MKELGTEIYAAVKSGKLRQPFDGAGIRHACPGWANHTYFTFCGKHAVGNGKTTELFIRVGRGRYTIIDSK